MNLAQARQILYHFGFDDNEVFALSIKPDHGQPYLGASKIHFTTNRNGPFLSDTRIGGNQWICDAQYVKKERRVTIKLA